MERAVVAIGLRKTGNLPQLQAATDGAKAFASWAKTSQGIPADRVALITDESGPVSRSDIYDAVSSLVDRSTIEQLLIYFSGHGVNIGYNELWLLSAAPEDTQAAVNLGRSRELARYCGIPHVVFISDTCRTAAESIRAQSITGAEIFPNFPGGADTPGSVDSFFATLLGRPAFEIRDARAAADGYHAIYTTVMLSALEGSETSIVEDGPDGSVIRPRALSKYLTTAVPRALARMSVSVSLVQQPDARIESDERFWLALLRRDVASKIPAALVLPEDRSLASDLPSVAQDELATALGISPVQRKRLTQGSLSRGAAPESLFEQSAEKVLPFGPDHFATQCGIKTRGLTIRDAFSRFADTVLSPERNAVRVSLAGDRRAANVVLTFDDGTGVVIPAVAGFLAALTFDEDGALDDLTYEPSANTWRWKEYAKRAAEVRRLRGVIATAASLGVFRLDDDAVASALVAHIRSAKSVDPTMAVYAAYAFNDRRMRGQIREMESQLHADLGVRFLDIAMLAFELGKATPPWKAVKDVFPCVPLLAQGWNHLGTFEINLPGRLDGVRQHLRPSSIWSHFDGPAIDVLQQTVGQGKVG
jgi:hypothetical protein